MAEPATERQKEYLRQLCTQREEYANRMRERNAHDEFRHLNWASQQWFWQIVKIKIAGLSKAEASQYIDLTKKVALLDHAIAGRGLDSMTDDEKATFCRAIDEGYLW